MRYRLFLDDERFPRQVTWVLLPTNFDPDWVIVRTYQQFVDYITTNGLPEFISFDHDLAEEYYREGYRGAEPVYGVYKEKTGYEAAKWLRQYCDERGLRVPAFTVHSMNPIGRVNITNALR